MGRSCMILPGLIMKLNHEPIKFLNVLYFEIYDPAVLKCKITGSSISPY